MHTYWHHIHSHFSRPFHHHHYLYFDPDSLYRFLSCKHKYNENADTCSKPRNFIDFNKTGPYLQMDFFKLQNKLFKLLLLTSLR